MNRMDKEEGLTFSLAQFQAHGHHLHTQGGREMELAVGVQSSKIVLLESDSQISGKERPLSVFPEKEQEKQRNENEFKICREEMEQEDQQQPDQSLHTAADADIGKI